MIGWFWLALYGALFLFTAILLALMTRFDRRLVKHLCEVRALEQFPPVCPRCGLRRDELELPEPDVEAQRRRWESE